MELTARFPSALAEGNKKPNGSKPYDHGLNECCVVIFSICVSPDRK